MKLFDVSMDWVILLSPDVPESGSACLAAEDLCGFIGTLRSLCGIDAPRTTLRTANSMMPADTVPLILLNILESVPGKNGFSWRAGKSRIEIYGESERGLVRGIYDFLRALGLGFSTPEDQGLPKPAASDPNCFTLDRQYSSGSGSSNPEERRRYFSGLTVPKQLPTGSILWAVRHDFDALVLPPLPEHKGAAFLKEVIGSGGRKIYAECVRRGLAVEIGAALFRRFIPRSLFYKNSSLFRMESGRRKKDSNFCPTNPDALTILKDNARRFFRFYEDCDCFHLWLPDPETHSQPLDRWCSCPGCRAFSPFEQLLIALNSCADALAEVRPQARISYPHVQDAASVLKPRENMFKI